METIVPCIEYVESHLSRVSSDTLSNSELLNLLGGDGGFQVDVVLYLIERKLKPADVEYIRRLAPLTNVIPVIAKADRLSPTELAVCKQQVMGQLRDAAIRTFTFTSSAKSGFEETTQPNVPYSVSNATGSDPDVMDASLLMSPDYVQPLVATELQYLVNNLFSLDGASWVRHAAAKKYLQWRDTSPSMPRHLYRPLGLPKPDIASGLTPTTGALVGLPTSLAIVPTSQRQRYDTSTNQFHMVDWAADLQRSMASERTLHEAFNTARRAGLRNEELGTVAANGTLVTARESKKGEAPRRRKSARYGVLRGAKHHQDPLGLLQVAADLKAKGWVAFEVLGSLGVIGGLAFWLSRHHWPGDPVMDLAGEWARVWGLDV
jgi:hypothetical protein